MINRTEMNEITKQMSKKDLIEFIESRMNNSVELSLLRMYSSKAGFYNVFEDEFLRIKTNKSYDVNDKKVSEISDVNYILNVLNRDDLIRFTMRRAFRRSYSN